MEKLEKLKKLEKLEKLEKLKKLEKLEKIKTNEKTTTNAGRHHLHDGQRANHGIEGMAGDGLCTMVTY